MSNIELTHWLGRVSATAVCNEFAIAVSTVVDTMLGPRHQLVINQADQQVIVDAKQSPWLLRLLLDGVRAVETLDPTVESRSWRVESQRARDVEEARAYRFLASVEQDQRSCEVRELVASWIERSGADVDAFREWWADSGVAL
ncbi:MULTISPECIES: hypothetical protein [Rhodococcus]|uniref:hypothetical protein n=1 Tax=Rhodococcus TaxID=1827 RepID=UPI001BA56CE8|nr:MULTISPECIES: hypothetical protein [Rhodococcus]MBS3692590.1 hypothetical protein [Rhodococcus qingshengii]MDF3316498.1 hypothetical protein [Rhodococcus sp. C3V]